MNIKEINTLLKMGICPEEFIYTKVNWEWYFEQSYLNEENVLSSSNSNVDGGENISSSSDK